MPVSQVPPAIKSVLVLEDNFLIALDMEEMLVALGVTSVDVATTKSKAMELIADHTYDFAILDINLGDDTSFAVADALMARGISFGFTSGYGELLALPAIFAMSRGSTNPSARERSAASSPRPPLRETCDRGCGSRLAARDEPGLAKSLSSD